MYNLQSAFTVFRDNADVKDFATFLIEDQIARACFRQLNSISEFRLSR